MSITKLFNIVTIVVAVLCLSLLGLGFCTLFLPRMGFSLWCRHYLNAPTSLVFYSLGLIGLVFLFVLIKKKQTLLARFGVSENRVINLNSEQRKRLNTILLVFACLGPVLFTFVFYFAFRGPELLTLFLSLVPGILGVLSSVLLLRINSKTYPEKFTFRGLALIMLLLCNLCAVGPVYVFCRSCFNFRLYEWIALVLFQFLIG